MIQQEEKTMSNRPINQHKVSPFQGEPYTIPTKDEHGNSAMRVYINEITPEGASWADGLGALYTFALFVFLFFVGAGSGNLLVWIICMIATFSAHKSIVRHFYLSMVKSTEVMFTPTEFRVKAEGGAMAGL